LFVAVPVHRRRGRWWRLIFRILSSVGIGNVFRTRRGFDSLVHVSGRGLGGEHRGPIRRALHDLEGLSGLRIVRELGESVSKL